MVINYLAVLVCGVLAMVLGMLWYGPLFGKEWMRLVGVPEDAMEQVKNDPAKKRQMYWNYLIQFVFALVAAYILAHVVANGAAAGRGGVGYGLYFAFFSWLGFTVPPTLGMVLWEGKPWKYWWIVAGYWVVYFCIAGALLAVWS